MSKLFVESLDEVASNSFINNLNKDKDKKSNATTSSIEFKKEFKDDSNQIKKEEEKKPKKRDNNEYEYYYLLPSGSLAKDTGFGVYKVKDKQIIKAGTPVTIQPKCSQGVIKDCTFGRYVVEKIV